MNNLLIPANSSKNPPSFALTKNNQATIPSLIFSEGENAMLKFVDFFIATIRNPHTRQAYFRANEYFLDWCLKKGVSSIRDIKPFMVGVYIEAFNENSPPATVKLHLSGIRGLFDYLVIQQILDSNPSKSVKPPKLIRRKGTTPILTADEMSALFSSFNTSKLADLRDRAIIAIMAYSFTRVGAVSKMQVKDYYSQGNKRFLVLVEKGTVETKKIAHHKIVEYLDEYLDMADLRQQRDTPLFRSLTSKSGTALSENYLSEKSIWNMVKKRAKKVGLPPEITCHSFRGTGITNYLINGGDIEVGAEMANHASISTTQFYDQRDDKVTQSEVERVRF